MPATSKDQLLTVSEREFAKLSKLLARITDEQALAKDSEDTSIKDVVAHRAHWIGLFMGWRTDGLAGCEVHFPAPGYKWNELPRYNAALRAKQSALGWTAAKGQLDAAHAQLMALLESQTDHELYGGPMQGAKNNWTTGRWAEAAGPSHYRSAAKYIRARLKELG